MAKNMKKFQNMISYLAIITISFYLMPLLGKLGKGIGGFVFILLLAIPIICFITSMFYGIKHGFCFIFPLIGAIIFIPTIFIYYNSSAWVYTVLYGIILLTGNFLGSFLSKIKDHKNFKG